MSERQSEDKNSVPEVEKEKVSLLGRIRRGLGFRAGLAPLLRDAERQEAGGRELAFSDEAYDYSVALAPEVIPFADLADRLSTDGGVLIINRPRLKNTDTSLDNLLISRLVSTPDGDRAFSIQIYGVNNFDNGYVNYVSTKPTTYDSAFQHELKRDGRQDTADAGIVLPEGTRLIQLTPHEGRPQNPTTIGSGEQDTIIKLAAMYQKSAYSGNPALDQIYIDDQGKLR